MRKILAGFLLGLLIFFAANLLIAHFMSDCGLPAAFGVDYCADDIVRAGWLGGTTVPKTQGVNHSEVVLYAIIPPHGLQPQLRQQ